MMKFVICLALVCLAQGFPQNKPQGNKIVGGELATLNEFPYLVALLLDDSHNCGGSILDKNHIVTAAHCVRRAVSRYSVTAGEHNLLRTDGTEQTVAVSKIFIHEDYQNGDGSYANDIAILRLAAPLEFNNAVQPIALPKAGHISTGNVEVSGWGSLGDRYPILLRKLTVPIVGDQVCEALYERTPDLRVNGDIMICAGYIKGGQDSCSGDSGGPLAAYDDGVYLAGVVSWGEGCALPGFPGIYAEVVKYVDWINAIIG